MSQPELDDSDPLLVFSSEPPSDSETSRSASGISAPSQTIAEPVDPPRKSPPPAASVPIEPLIARIERLETALDDSKIQVSTLNAELATLVRAIADIKGTMGALTSTVGGVKGTVGALTSTVGDVKGTVGALTSTVGDVKGTVGDVKSTVGALRSTVGEVKNTVGALNSAMSNVKSTVGDLTGRVGALTSTVGEVKSTVGDLSSVVGNVKSTVGDLTGRVGALSSTVGDVKSTVGDFNSALGNVKSTVGDLTGRVGALSSTVGDVKSRVTDLNSIVADFKSRVGDLKKQIRPELIRAAMGLPRPARTFTTASTVVAALVGLITGVFGWVYFTGHEGSRLGAVPGPEPQQEIAFVPADQPVAPEAPATPATAASVPVSVPVVSRTPAKDAPAKNTRVNYVGTLSVDAQPAGEVFLDRKSAGQTPLMLTNLRAGSHLIWVERDGYRRWTRVVQVPADRVTRLFADLEPLSAR